MKGCDSSREIHKEGICLYTKKANIGIYFFMFYASKALRYGILISVEKNIPG